MARSSAQLEKRRRELIERLGRGESISTTQMARRFGVTVMTIRRDLKALADDGALLRCYGGGIAARRITFEFAFDERHQKHLAEKRRIGRKAATLLAPRQTVFLDTGTTTLEVARALATGDVPFKAVTSSLVIASELWGREQIELMLLGGRVRPGSPDLAGPATEDMLEKITADVAFLGSEGIDPRRGAFAGDFEAARVATRMAESARRVIIVADASKLGQAGDVRYLSTEKMQELITDRAAPKAVVASLRRRGVRVTLA